MGNPGNYLIRILIPDLLQNIPLSLGFTILLYIEPNV
jgi:hypothetical protein